MAPSRRPIPQRPDLGIHGHPESAVPDLFITRELARRTGSRADHRLESLALQELAARMAAEPEAVLPRFVELALEMTGAVSAGISLLDDEPAPATFRWISLRGSLAAFEGTTTPRDFSPCGVTLDRDEPTLSRRPERVYGWIADAGLTIPEVLLVPLHVGAAALGTLWIVSDWEGRFDSGHARSLTELAAFVGIALRMSRTEQALQQALEEQRTIAREMDHRVKNVFAMTESMIRVTMRAAASKEDLAHRLEGRIRALAHAHALVRRDFGQGEVQGADLAGLIAAIVRPHEAAQGPARFAIRGPAIPCGSHAANHLALIVHELVTNAAKYGALLSEDGRIAVAWGVRDGRLHLRWREQGGPAIVREPEREGFGSALMRGTIRQLGGSLDRAWPRKGLLATMTLPLEALAG